MVSDQLKAESLRRAMFGELVRLSRTSIADEIRGKIEADKKAKTAARIAKLKAAKSGDTKRMPLSGKAAMERILNPELDRL
jgi:hypothetical protein